MTHQPPPEILIQDTQLDALARAIEQITDFMSPPIVRFTEYYAGSSTVSAAAREAKISASTGSQHLATPAVRHLLRLIQQRNQLQSGIDVAWKRAKLVQIIERSEEDNTRIKALDTLNKMDGDYQTPASEVNVNVSIVSEIQAARARVIKPVPPLMEGPNPESTPPFSDSASHPDRNPTPNPHDPLLR